MSQSDYTSKSFLVNYIAGNLGRLRDQLAENFPRIFVILGNDDGSGEESVVQDIARRRYWEYVNLRNSEFAGREVFGYSFVPPSPFLLKDWERYDVSRYVDPGCISPEDGQHSLEVSSEEIRFATIKQDLETLTRGFDLEQSVFLFHTPPYDTNLDTADNKDVMIDGVPLDQHLGSIAVRRFIEKRQPYLTLHGHVHESTRVSGSWRDQIGRTTMFSAAHDGPELAVISFDLCDLAIAKRELIG